VRSRSKLELFAAAEGKSGGPKPSATARPLDIGGYLNSGRIACARAHTTQRRAHTTQRPDDTVDDASPVGASPLDRNCWFPEDMPATAFARIDSSRTRPSCGTHGPLQYETPWRHPGKLHGVIPGMTPWCLTSLVLVLCTHSRVKLRCNVCAHITPQMNASIHLRGIGNPAALHSTQRPTKSTHLSLGVVGPDRVLLGPAHAHTTQIPRTVMRCASFSVHA